MLDISTINFIEDHAKFILDNDPHISFDKFYKLMLSNLKLTERRDEIKDSISRSSQEIKSNINKLIKEHHTKLANKYLYHIARLADPFNPKPGKPIPFLQSSTNTYISIVGSGPAGLLLAKSLDNKGYNITIYEKRSENECLSRFIIIAIKCTKHLIKMIGNQTFQSLLNSGGIYEEETQILRIPIAVLQQIILDSLSDNIKIKFNCNIDSTSLNKKILRYKSEQHIHICILASGANTIQDLKLNDIFNLLSFEQYTTKVNEFVFLNRTLKFPRYYRSFIPGKNWLVMGIQVNTCKNFQKKFFTIIKDSKLIDTRTEITMNKLSGYNQDELLQYTIVKTPGEYITDTKPIYQHSYQVCPRIAINIIERINNTPIILLGDATGTAHPITISGSDKYLKTIPLIDSLITIYTILKKEIYHNFSKSDIDRLINLFESLYALCIKQVVEEVFFKTLLFSIYTNMERNPS